MLISASSERLFDSQELADKEEKGEQSTRSKRDEKKPASSAKDLPSECLSIRSDGCAVGIGGTLGSSDFARGGLCGSHPTRHCQCHSLRLKEWMSVAHAAS